MILIFTTEELRKKEAHNYKLVTDVYTKLKNLNGCEVGYGNSRKGKMVINFNGHNYLINIGPIQQGTLEETMKDHSYIFASNKAGSVFQFESDGMKNMLKGVKSDSFEDLVIV